MKVGQFFKSGHTYKLFFQKENLLKELKKIEFDEFVKTEDGSYDVGSYLYELERYYSDLLMMGSELFYESEIKKFINNNFKVSVVRETPSLKENMDFESYRKEKFNLIKSDKSNFMFDMIDLDNKYFDTCIVTDIYFLTDYKNESYEELMKKVKNDLLPLVQEYIKRIIGVTNAEFNWGIKHLEVDCDYRKYATNWEVIKYEELIKTRAQLFAFYRDVNRYIEMNKRELEEVKEIKDIDLSEAISNNIDCADIHKKVIEKILINLDDFILNLFTNNQEKQKEKTKKRNKPLKMFEWKGTEESILRITELLYNAGFLTKNSYSVRSAVLRDTFIKIDEEDQKQNFKNEQLNTVYSEYTDEDKKRKKNNEPSINEKNSDHDKFDKLLRLLKKLLKDE